MGERRGATLAVGDDAAGATLAAAGLPVLRLADVSMAPGEPATPGLGDPVVAFASGADLVWHSNRSLLGAALSMGTFLGLDAHRPWLSTLALSSWDGMHALLVGLDAGATMVLAPRGSPLSTRSPVRVSARRGGPSTPRSAPPATRSVR
ncbi:MAG: hypothetical protein M5U19_08805 [Microthrixaceae bacterium]|nr:hypothetical protein [Microthrixaceae bacterium]